MSESLTYCIARGSRVFLPTDGWKRVHTGKALCGKLVRVTTVKAGDVRLSQPVAVITVRGHQVAAHPRDVRLVGRGLSGARRRARKRR